MGDRMHGPLTNHQLRLARMRAQGFLPEQRAGTKTVEHVVHRVCGIQAQDGPSTALSVRSRSTGLTARDVETAVLKKRSVVKTICMRGTLHLLPVDDFQWVVSLVGPPSIAASLSRMAKMGLDEETNAKAMGVLMDFLAGRGPTTRNQVKERLTEAGLRFDDTMVYNLVRRAAMEGAVCVGPVSGQNQTYVLVEDWIGQTRSVPVETGLRELARRYLRAFGPATPKDMSAWSGLPMRDVNAGWKDIGDELVEVTAPHGKAWALKGMEANWLEPVSEPVVNLASAFDTYLLGYAGRDVTIASEFSKHIAKGGGWILPTLLVDGEVVATWRTYREKGRVDVEVSPFAKLASDVKAGLNAETADIGRFLGVESRLKVK